MIGFFAGVGLSMIAFIGLGAWYNARLDERRRQEAADYLRSISDIDP